MASSRHPATGFEIFMSICTPYSVHAAFLFSKTLIDREFFGGIEPPYYRDSRTCPQTARDDEIVALRSDTSIQVKEPRQLRLKSEHPCRMAWLSQWHGRSLQGHIWLETRGRALRRGYATKTCLAVLLRLSMPTLTRYRTNGPANKAISTLSEENDTGVSSRR